MRAPAFFVNGGSCFPCARDGLLEEVRDREYEVFDRAIDVQVSNLRRKLGDDPKNPRFVRTVRSAGYMLVDPDAER